MFAVHALAECKRKSIFALELQQNLRLAGVGPATLQLL